MTGPRTEPEVTFWRSVAPGLAKGVSPWLYIPLAIFLGSFGLRMWHLEGIRSTIFFQHPVFDEAFYDQQARYIASGNWIGHQAFFMGPLYAYFLGFLYLVSNGSKYFALTIQSALGAASCALCYFIGRRVFSPRVALLSAILCSFYGVLIFYDGLLLMETLTLFLNMLCLLLLVEAGRTHRWRFYLGAGLCLGLSALGRATVLLFGLAVVIWILTRSPKINRRRVVNLVVFSGAALASVAVVSVRNYCVEKDFVLISANGGLNSYIGNGPGATGTFRVLEEEAVAPGEITGRLEAERSTGRMMSLGEVSEWWYHRTLSFIGQHPYLFFRNLMWKIQLFWNSYEIPQLEWYSATRSYSPILRLPLVTSGFIIPLGLLGMIISLRRSRGLTMLHAYILIQTLSISLFFVTARYRVTVLPILCVFAAYALAWLIGKGGSRGYSSLLLGIGTCIALVWLTSPARLSLNMEELRRWHRITTGLRYSQSDSASDQAESLLKEATTEHPQDPESHLYYGIILRQAARYPEALQELQIASALDPDNPVIPFQIGKTYSKMGADSLATTSFIASLSLAPLYKEAHEHLGLTYVRLRRYEDALKEFAIGVGIDPTDSSLRLNLGVTYGKMGMTDEAIEQLRAALRYDNANWKARYNLAVALIEEGRRQDAREQLQVILKNDPDNEAARRALSELSR